VATLATLEIAPAHAGAGWVLTVTVEDEIGPRVSGARLAAETEQQIDIGTFYNMFGTANVVAEADGPSARANVIRLLDAIERNRHAVTFRPSKP
jgi:hypothetical protein